MLPQKLNRLSDQPLVKIVNSIKGSGHLKTVLMTRYRDSQCTSIYDLVSEIFYFYVNSVTVKDVIYFANVRRAP